MREEIADQVRKACDALPLSFIHVQVAIETGLHEQSADAGIAAAQRIAAKVEDLRKRFNVHFDR